MTIAKYQREAFEQMLERLSNADMIVLGRDKLTPKEKVTLQLALTLAIARLTPQYAVHYHGGPRDGQTTEIMEARRGFKIPEKIEGDGGHYALRPKADFFGPDEHFDWIPDEPRRD